MDFENKVPEWHAEGLEPSEELKTTGFTAGYKPPAGFFNWFWHGVSVCLSELQRLFKGHAEDTNNPHGVTAAQIGLENVDNTADTDKYVAYAQRAGNADKTQYALTVRLNGGREENTDMWTFDGSTSRTINITPEKIGAATAEDVAAMGDIPTQLATHTADTTLHVTAAERRKWNNALGWVMPIESTDGRAYTAEISGFNSFPDGLCVTVIPNMTSVPGKEITFNLNGYGDKRIYMRTPGGKDKYAEVSVFLQDTPCRLLYMDDVAGWLVDTPFDQLTSGWWDMEAGVDELETGKFYFQYEE